jgi:hypothetical protein
LLKNSIIKEREIRVENLPAYKKVHLINAMIDLEDEISVLADAIVF